MSSDNTENNKAVVANSEKVYEPTARVVLPQPDSDDEGDSKGQEEGQVPDEEFLSDYPDDTEELDLVHARISSLSNLNLQRFAGSLQKLCLRQNFISALDEVVFHPLTKLTELDLYDNKLKTVGRALDTLSQLKVLDLSFNLFKSVPDVLEHLPSLEIVYFVQNKISKITGLATAINLTSLELGGNRIRKIENLEGLVNLEELWLGKNKIATLENLKTLTKLKILSIQSNRITRIEGLESLENLEQLYLSHNGVKRIEGLEKNTKLNTVDIGSNFIEAIENLSHLHDLNELWLNGNKIPNLHTLDKELAGITALRTVYLEGNPCQTNDMGNYRRKIMLALPQVTQIDATYVRH